MFREQSEADGVGVGSSASLGVSTRVDFALKNFWIVLWPVSELGVCLSSGFTRFEGGWLALAEVCFRLGDLEVELFPVPFLGGLWFC